MTTAAALKYLLALAAVLGIWMAPGSRSSLTSPQTPVPVYLTGGQIVVINGRAYVVDTPDEPSRDTHVARYFSR